MCGNNCLSLTFSVSACPFPYEKRNPSVVPSPVLLLLPSVHGPELQWTAWLSEEPPATHPSALMNCGGKTQTQAIRSKHDSRANHTIYQHQISDFVSDSDEHRYLRIGFILLAVLLVLDVDPPEPTAPFPEGLLEFISADF